MSIFNLSYAITRHSIDVLRKALAGDKLFQPDGTGKSRSAETIVLDGWGYQVRDFPIVVVTGVPGAYRQVGIGDYVRPFFGVSLVEDPDSGASAILRTFDVPLALNVGTLIEVRYTGDPAVAPSGPFLVEVKSKVVGPDTIRYVEIAGTAVGPASAFPLSKWEASTKGGLATGDIFGGWYDASLEVVVGARNTQTRDSVMNTVEHTMFFTKKRELRRRGLVVTGMRQTGITQQEYGNDKLHFSKASVSISTEFEAIAQFVESVGDIKVVGTATNTL